MSDYLKRLTEARASAWEQGKTLLDAAAAENRDLSAEEQVTYDRINADIDGMAARAQALLDAEQRNKDAVEAFEKLLGPASTADARKERNASDEFRAFARGEGGKTFEVLPESRDLGKASATAGGNTVPTSFYNKLWEHMIEVSGVLSARPTILRTTSGENFELPVTTAHSSGALTAEAAAISESDPAFAKRTLSAYKYATLIQAPSELLTDTGVDLEGYLARQAGRAVGNALGVHLVTGDASSKPSGIVTTATTGVTGSAAVAGVFTADNLIDLFFSVIAPYRNSSSCGWLMKDATLANVRKLKDANDAYLWQPSIQVGAPDTLLGKPVHTDPNVAAVAATAKSVVFGDISAYHVRLAGGIRFERSDEFAFNTDMSTFRCIVRGDGILADQTGAVKVFVGGAAA